MSVKTARGKQEEKRGEEGRGSCTGTQQDGLLNFRDTCQLPDAHPADSRPTCAQLVSGALIFKQAKKTL